MQRWSIAYALGAILSVLPVACGSSGSGSGTNGAGDDGSIGSGTGLEAGTPCDAFVADDSGGRLCTLAMPVQGGLTGTLNGERGCGDGAGTATGGYITWNSASPDGRVSANIQSGLPEQTGTYPLSSLTISTTAADGETQSWTAPAGACTITVRSVDVECQSAFAELKTIVHGTGTCTQPAAPDTGTSAGRVTIGDFAFEHWL